jgi:long-chain acyl-CoA synthetase
MSIATQRRTERPPGLDAATLAEAFQITAAAHPDRCALRLKEDAFTMTWGEYADKVQSVAAGLAALGLGRGHSLAIMLTNRPEFHFFDTAAMHLGATPFSIYNTYAREQIQYQVGDAGARIVVTEKAFLERVSSLEGVDHVVVVDADNLDDALTIADVEAEGDPEFDFEAAWRAVGPDDVLTLIYTSGTTGPPKGVQLTHRNEMSAVQGFDELVAFPDDGRVVSWLPMAHIAERACSH